MGQIIRIGFLLPGVDSVALCYPRLIERFPAYRDEVLRWRFRDALIDELCRDYDCVVKAIDAGGQRSEFAGAGNDERRELQALARKLEHEFLERLAAHAASEHK